MKQRTLLHGLPRPAAEGRWACRRTSPRSSSRCATAIRTSPRRIDRLRAAGCDRILAVPLFPQYSASATAVGARRRVRRTRNGCGECRRCGRSTASTTIPATSRRSRATSTTTGCSHGRPERLVLSFHGLPRRSLDLGDPYHCQCQKTARLLATELGLDAKQYVVTFQSRFGTRRVARSRTRSGHARSRLAKDGVARVDVALPGFVVRLPRNARGDRHRGASRRSSRAGGRGVPRDSRASTSTRRGSPRWSRSSCANLGGWLAPPPDAAAARGDDGCGPRPWGPRVGDTAARARVVGRNALILNE